MRKICYAMLIAVIITGCTWLAYASGGSADDPAVTLSYVSETWLPNIMNTIREKIISKFDPAFMSADAKSGSLQNYADVSLSGSGIIDYAAKSVLQELQEKGKYLYHTKYMSPVSVVKDDLIQGTAGTTVILRSGSAKINSGMLINITKGSELSKGSAISQNTIFMFPESGGAVLITSDSATLIINGGYGVGSVRYKSQYYDLADALKSMGLVRGTAKGMELYRANTRAESVTMLIRLLSQENQVLTGQYSHPFIDIDDWAENYIGYAYSMGYARGVSNTRFNSSGLTSANDYMTFLLRALGYSESRGDFTWSGAMTAAVKFGVITQAEKDKILRAPFYRDQIMYLSYYALFAKLSGSDQSLLDKLVSDGAVDRQAAEAAISKVTRIRQ